MSAGGERRGPLARLDHGVDEAVVDGLVSGQDLVALDVGADLLEEILELHTGQTRARIHIDTDRDFVMEAEEARAYGIIDDVISSRDAVDRTGPIR